MIKDRPNRYSLWFYSSWFRVLQKLFFRRIQIINQDVFVESKSVLLLQNHFSYYDGFWSMLLCQKVFHRQFHVMMLEEQLRKRMFLTRCGAFSVRKNSRDLMESIHYAKALLQNSRNVVTIYPSGEIVSQHQQHFSFEQGFSRLAGEKNVQIAFAVVLTDYFSEARPEIRIYVENFRGEISAKAIENAYHTFYQSCILKQME
ncbi:MAG TPA: lysophospholipid acyltransferase family protein [Prolixibacteraceae bacterium]|nr:lysophospholipid acyltransferase family protein [Prolixibacteraceae bacterium]